jgi:pyruvate kinase
MLAANFKRTKILATVGPASADPKTLERLIKAGANGVRLNFSHGTHESHGAVITLAREISHKLEKPIAIVADLQGPKIRVGDLPLDGLALVRGTEVRFGYNTDYEKTGIIPVQHDIAKYVKEGEIIYLRDGHMRVHVRSIEHGVITARVDQPGILFTHQGLNLPDADFGGDILTDKDVADIAFVATQDVDYVALSFVQSAADVRNLRRRLKALGSNARIITKLETKAGALDLENIVDESDGMMVARGDLAIEVSPEEVPIIQKRILALGRANQKFVIVATQMLESMMVSQQPSRAEVSDIAGATEAQADCLMLSGETALGQFPVETVAMMKRVITRTEQAMLHWHYDFDFHSSAPAMRNAIAAAVVILARQVDAKVIIAETSSGQTARNVSSMRPPVPIVMVTHDPRTYSQMALYWGGKSYLNKKPKGAGEYVVGLLREAGNLKRGESVVVASGHQPGISGGTDTIQIRVAE